MTDKAPSAPAEAIDALYTLLRLRRFVSMNEAELQGAIAALLAAEGIPFEREKILTRADRVDFLVGGAIGLEVKVTSSTPRVLEQLERYAACPEVLGLLLVTTRSKHRPLEGEIGGKPVRVFHTMGGLV